MKKLKHLAVSCVLAVSGPLATTLYAQSLLEEIIVTAQKREESIQDIGISISAFDEETINRYNAQTAKELVALTSGVLLEEHFGTNPIYVIRGIGLNDFKANSSPSAAVYVDEVFKPNLLMGSPPVFDVDRTEILKGPQGTLYGRNASSGAVNVITKKPTDQYEGYIKGTYGSFDRYSVEGAYGGPINDNVKFRIAGMHYDYLDSVYDSVTSVATSTSLIRQSTSDDLYAPDEFALRGQILWQPSDQTDVLFKLSYREQGGSTANAIAVPTRQNPDSTGICPGTGFPADADRSACVAGITGQLYVPPSEDFDLSYNFAPEMDAEFISAMIRIDHEMEWATLTSITSFDTMDFFQNLDFDATLADGLSVRHNFEEEIYNQELRLTGQRDNLVKWILGLNFAYDDYEEPLRLLYAGEFAGDNRGTFNYVGAPGRLAPTSTNQTIANSLFQQLEQPTTSVAVFTDNELDITDTLSLIVGYRFTHEKREFDGSCQVLLTNGGSEFCNQSGLGEAVGSNELVTDRSSGRVGINWRPTDDTLIYALFSESFKSGGFEGSLLNNITLIQNPYEAEIVRMIEFGFKSQPLDNLRINAALFYNDFQNPQTRFTVNITNPVTGLPVATGLLSNLDSADVYGAEAEITWLPLDGLIVGGTLTLLDTQISQDIPPPSGVNFDGKSLSHSPDISATLMSNYEFPIRGGDYTGRVGANMKFVGEHMLRPESFLIDEEDAYVLVDAQASVSTVDGRYEFAVWGRNLTDEQVRTVGIGNFGSIEYNINQPRSWGIGLTARF